MTLFPSPNSDFLFPRPSALFAQLFQLNLTQAKILWQVWFQEATNYQISKVIDSTEAQNYGLSITELAMILQLKPTTVQHEIRGLIQRGLLERSRVRRKFRYFSGNSAIVQTYVGQYLEAAQMFLTHLENFLNQTPSKALLTLLTQFQEFILGWRTVGPEIPQFAIRLPYHATEQDVIELAQDITGKATMVPDVHYFKDLSLISTDAPTQSQSVLQSNLLDVLVPQVSKRRLERV